jgi:hypothetical protein
MSTPSTSLPRAVRPSPKSDPFLWQQSVAVARQACARIFRDGGAPADALAAFGLAGADGDVRDWGQTVDLIATAVCAGPQLAALRRAA